MDRTAYKSSFKKDILTRWVCPSCNKGPLKVKANTFHAEETKKSKRQHNDKAWNPEWIGYVYSCLLECTNSKCKDTVASSGFGYVDFDIDYDEYGSPEQKWDDFFIPEYFTPQLNIFCPPKSAPKNVVKEIEKSFSLFFSDPPSAANHLRIAIEDLLTFIKIKRYEVKKKRRVLLSLHRRIELIPKKRGHLQDLFFAVKWLGNAGSHSGEAVKKDDVLDAYEIMDEILNDLFVKKTDRAKQLAKQINKLKGPINSKKIE